MKFNKSKEDRGLLIQLGETEETVVKIIDRKEATSEKLLGETVSQGYQFNNHISKTVST